MKHKDEKSYSIMNPEVFHFRSMHLISKHLQTRQILARANSEYSL